ncbi:MAG: hypothetical protein ACLTDT_13045 [Clostridium sp.]
MNPSRIEQAIDEIYNYVEECKPSKLYPSKVVVDREQLYDLLDELRLCAPEEIKRYQKIITNRDGILNEAQQRAEDMLSLRHSSRPHRFLTRTRLFKPHISVPRTLCVRQRKRQSVW